LLLRGIFDLARDFFYQDGDDMPLAVLEGGNFVIVRRLLETACAPTSSLVSFFNKKLLIFGFNPDFSFFLDFCVLHTNA
jgi:hypothetical protein